MIEIWRDFNEASNQSTVHYSVESNYRPYLKFLFKTMGYTWEHFHVMQHKLVAQNINSTAYAPYITRNNYPIQDLK